jgi:membrane peptidoglycan carboxypeptidase
MPAIAQLMRDPSPSTAAREPLTADIRLSRPRAARLRRRLLIGLAVAVAAALALAAAGIGYLLTLRGVGDAEARVRRIVAEHGGVVAPLPPPAKLGTAVVDVEDENFYENVLVNVLEGASRAALATLQTSGDPGGSTINQQLAKRLYPHSGGLGGTLEEIGLAVKLSTHYSKARILSMYLNSAYYGNGFWGDVAASRGYFGVPPRELSWGEAALLAGLLQAPSTYDPERHPALARQRQWHVLERLVENHVLSEGQAAAVFRRPLALRVPAGAGG